MGNKLSDNAKALLTEAIVFEEGILPPKRIDLRKLRAVVTTKKERSDKGKAFIFYLCFMAVYINMVILQRNPYNSQTMQLGVQKYLIESAYVDPYSFEVKRFEDTTTVDDLWHWLQAILVENVIVDTYPNGRQTNKSDDGNILMHNKLTSGFRLTQRRVKNDSCILREEFQNFAPNCYGRVYWDARIGPTDQEPYLSSDESELWVYQDSTIGSVDIPYLDSGYFQVFQNGKQWSRERMASLRRQMWINEGTAWVRADFVTYNPNVRLFGYFQFQFDMRPSGQILPEFRSETMAAALYETIIDFGRLGLEIVCLVSWCWLTYSTIRDARTAARKNKSRWAYLKEFDNKVCVIQILLFLCCFCWWVAIVQNPIRDQLVVTETSISFKDGSQPNFTTLSILVHDYFVASAVNLVLALFRIMSMMKVNPNISQLSDTFTRCRKNIVQFGLVLVLMIIAFQLMAHLMFGAKMREFSTFDTGFISTVRVMLGTGTYTDLSEVDPIAAPVFYYPFVFIMIFVVFNMTIAIIMDGYALSQEERKTARKSHLKELNEIRFYHQLGWGIVRQLKPFAACLPRAIRFRVMQDGTQVDRYTEPSMAEVVALLEPVEKIEERFLTVAEYKEACDQANMPVRETQLEQIAERLHCWEDFEEPVYKKERMEMRRIQDAEKMERTITLLQERVATIVATQQQMGAKVDAILRSFVVSTVQFPEAQQI
uniref:Polycystin cation channel PKD1/PKD2 domain-containing protein n=1 Tax=Hemiselmis andersenii TaxID=464988 RepID=A0A7S0TK97_HEMAN